MTERPKKLVVDCATNTTYEVELTDQEIAQREIDAAAYVEFVAKREAEATAKAAAKAGGRKYPNLVDNMRAAKKK